MNDPRTPRPAVWRALGFAAIFLLLAAVLIIGLVSSSVLDPRPAGPLQEELAARTLPVARGEESLVWQRDLVLPAPPYTLQLSAATESAAVAYGLVLGTPAAYLAVSVSPAGYAAVTRHTAGASEALLPWQPVAHVPVGQAENELRIDAKDRRITIWANREVLWEADLAAAAPQVALLARNDGEPATVSFRPLQLYAPNRP
jgi:hypothetical protein